MSVWDNYIWSQGGLIAKNLEGVIGNILSFIDSDRKYGNGKTSEDDLEQFKQVEKSLRQAKEEIQLIVGSAKKRMDDETKLSVKAMKNSNLDHISLDNDPGIHLRSPHYRPL